MRQENTVYVLIEKYRTHFILVPFTIWRIRTSFEAIFLAVTRKLPRE